MKELNKYIYFACVLAIIAGFLSSLVFILSTGNLPWFDPQLRIDGNSYFDGMASVVGNNDFLKLKDIYHSPGYQIYVSAVYKAFPAKESIFIVIKIVSWVLRILTLLMIYFMGERYFAKYTGLAASVLFSLSYKYYIYGNLLQYEVMLGFLITLYVFLLAMGLRNEKLTSNICFISISSFVLSIICLFQVRYLPFLFLSPVIIYFHFYRNKLIYKLSLVIVSLLPFLLLFGTWSIYQSLANNELVIGSAGSLFRFYTSNNPNAQGYAFPYPDIIRPAGLKFILLYPLRYLWLLKERFLFAFDIKKDVWYLGPPFMNVIKAKIIPDVCFSIMSFLIFLAGLFVKAKNDLKNSLWASAPLYIPVLSSFLLLFITFGSSRFIIPVIPVIDLFQAYALTLIFAKYL